MIGRRALAGAFAVLVLVAPGIGVVGCGTRPAPGGLAADATSAAPLQDGAQAPSTNEQRTQRADDAAPAAVTDEQRLKALLDETNEFLQTALRSDDLDLLQQGLIALKRLEKAVADFEQRERNRDLDDGDIATVLTKHRYGDLVMMKRSLRDRVQILRHDRPRGR